MKQGRNGNVGKFRHMTTAVTCNYTVDYVIRILAYTDKASQRSSDYVHWQDLVTAVSEANKERSNSQRKQQARSIQYTINLGGLDFQIKPL